MDLRIPAEAIEHLGQGRAGRPQIVERGSRIVGQVVQREEPQIRPVVAGGLPQVIADGGQHGFQSDLLPSRLGHRKRRSARRDPPPDDFGLLDVQPVRLGRHFGLGHTLHQPRAVGSAGLDQLSLGQGGDVEIIEVAALRARSVMAAMAMRSQDAAGLRGEFLLLILVRRDRAGSDEQAAGENATGQQETGQQPTGERKSDPSRSRSHEWAPVGKCERGERIQRRDPRAAASLSGEGDGGNAMR